MISETEFLTLDEHGYMQAVDIHTGEVRQLEGTMQVPVSQEEVEKLHRVLDAEGNLVYVQRSISLEGLKQVQGSGSSFPYTPLLADRICELVAQGHTLVDICKKPGFPSYSQLSRWRREHPGFNDSYKLARKDRAEIYFHKMLEEVEEAHASRDAVALARLRADFYKFAARVCSPDEYAEKSTLDARVAVGEFVIETGIRRDNDPGFNRDETKALIEESQGE